MELTSVQAEWVDYTPEVAYKQPKWEDSGAKESGLTILGLPRRKVHQEAEKLTWRLYGPYNVFIGSL